jgi:YHS domain-containing protein
VLVIHDAILASGATGRRGSGWLYSGGVPIRAQDIGDEMAIEIDPVCGMEVDTTTSQLSYEYEGKTYWFCGKGCMLEFKDDPEKYLDPDYVPSM